MKPDAIRAGRAQYNDIMFAQPHVLAAIDVTARLHIAALYGPDRLFHPPQIMDFLHGEIYDGVAR